MFKILYNDANPFDGLAPTPLIERSVERVHYAKKYCDIDRFVLKGVLTGDCQEEDSFAALFGKAEELCSRFSESFKGFAVVEDTGTGIVEIFSGPNAIIREISFDDSNYSVIVPFSVSLDVYGQDSFASGFGVLEPTQEVGFEEGEDGVITISKTTSARGFNTDNIAINNAIDFVQSATGLNPDIFPLFASNDNIENAVLVSFNERIDRLTATYSVDETWVYDQHGRHGQNSLYQSSTSVSSGEAGVQVQVNGSLRGGPQTSFSDLRDSFHSLDLIGAAQDVYEDFGYSGQLFAEPISKNISESSSEKTVSFSHIYSDTISEDPYLIDNISINNNTDNNKTCVNAQFIIRSVDTCSSSRWSKVNNYLDSFDIVQWIKDRLVDLGYDINLPNRILSKNVSYNEKSGSITLAAAICDKKIIVPSGFIDFNYSLQIQPAMPTFVPFQGVDCGGAHTVQKLGGVKRKSVTIQGEAVKENCVSQSQAEEFLKTYVNELKYQYLNTIDCFLSGSDVSWGGGDDKNSITFSFTWNEPDELIFDETTLHSPASGSLPDFLIYLNEDPIFINGSPIIFSTYIEP